MDIQEGIGEGMEQCAISVSSFQGRVVPTTTHTFSLAMLEAGATNDELQEQLNHSDPKTTQRYARHFKRQKNKHAAAIASRFGL